MKTFFALLAAAGLAALAGYASLEHIKADRAVVRAADTIAEVNPSTEPIINGGQWRVNCGTVDGGAATDALVPMDGGTVDAYVQAIYIAPCASGTTNCATTNNIRVGFSGDMSGALTSATGFEVGSSGRDGPGVSIDARQKIFCKSEGAAQQADVVFGRGQ